MTLASLIQEDIDYLDTDGEPMAESDFQRDNLKRTRLIDKKVYTK